MPRHVAIIMDGNGRWAKQHGLPRLGGHRVGTENLRRVIETMAEYGVEYLTLYAFSTENWNRPVSEVRGLFRILGQVIDRESRALHEKGARICHLGTMEGLDPKLQNKVRQALELTRNNRRITVCIAFNYGGRAEILEAVRRIVREGVPAGTINEEEFRRYLYSSEMPDPDLIIRTGGEMRISNFLLWQSAYSEYYSVPTYWPDFGKDDVEKALIAYSQRQRRFGGLGPGEKRGKAGGGAPPGKAAGS
ncbi:MAG: di-trans,poly-cis-decaprenylcistransferase [Chloroflexi bacterium]|nr:di-trans,poly-cis-decaprenylcistransferase [Chloroflexota bacterium]